MALENRVELKAHTDECGRRYGALECKIADWEKALGKRLDSQDQDNADIKKLGIRIFLGLFTGTLVVLGTVIGLWLHSAGLIK